MVINNVDRPNKEKIESLRDVSPNDIGHHYHFGYTSAEIEYLGSEKPVTMVGPVVTARIPPEDSTMVHKLTEVLEPGDVAVVDMGGHTDHAPWGEMTTRAAMASGAEGAVINGSITDSLDIEELGFPIYARGRSTRTTRLHGRGGDINVTVQAANAVVEPGDIAVGNEDGVVFIPSEKAERAVELCSGAEERERELSEKLENGVSLADHSGANDLIERNDLG